jgi:gamma-glutamylcyclotransferase (GGCT)/AIG2-like uncharacterized protein YtfP
VENSKTICVYGSLRVGDYNNDRFAGSDMKHIKTTKITGYELYSLGPYPCAVKTDNPEDELIVDILEVSDRKYQGITAMEHGAGYHSSQIEVDGIDATIYLFKTPPTFAPLVESGDWIKYKKRS